MFLNYKALLILIDNHKGSIVNSSVIYDRQKCLNVENVHLHFCTHILDENLYIQKLYMQSQDGHHCLLFYHKQFVLIKYYRLQYDKLFDDVGIIKKTIGFMMLNIA